MNGTSMASPHMAGVMALLRQFHPTWTVEELKALVMTTATHDLTTLGASGGDAYTPARVGAGRVDVKNALATNTTVYNFEDAGAVSVSFGDVQVPVDSTLTRTKTVAVENKGPDPVTYTVAFEESPSFVTPGVDFAVLDGTSSPVTTITLASAEEAFLTVSMAVDGAALKHTLDKTMTTLQVANPRQYMTEAGGYLTLTPTTGSSQVLRLPVYAVTRPVSAMKAAGTLNLPGTAGTTALGLSGVGINTGAALPVDIQSVVSAFELKGTSPDLHLDDSGKAADLQYVGVMSDRPARTTMSSSYLYFGLSTWANWTSPSSSAIEFDVYIDTTGDGVPDFIAYNSRLLNGSNPTDVFVTRLYKIGLGTYTSPIPFLNYYPGNLIDTAIFNSNVMVIPVPILRLALTDTAAKINFGVLSYNREWPVEGAPVDSVGADVTPDGTVTKVNLPYDARNLALDTSGGYTGLNLWDDQPGADIPVAYNEANIQGSLKGLLLLHFQNGNGARAEWVRVAPELAVVPAAQKVGVGLQGTLDVTASVADYTDVPDDVLVDSRVSLESLNHRNLAGETIEAFAVIGGVEHSIGSITLAAGQSSFWLSDFPLTPDRPAFNTQSNLTQYLRFKFIPTVAMGDDTVIITSQLVGAAAADFGTPANWVYASVPSVVKVEILPGPGLSTTLAGHLTYNVARAFDATITNPVGGADYSSAWLEFTLKNVIGAEISSFQVWNGSAWEEMSLAQSGPDVIAAGPVLGFAVAPDTTQPVPFKISFSPAGSFMVSKSIDVSVQLKYLGLTPHTLLATSEATLDLGPNVSFLPIVNP